MYAAELQCIPATNTISPSNFIHFHVLCNTAPFYS